MLVAGCVSPAHIAVDSVAGTSGFEREVVQGDGFRHVVYRHLAGHDAGRPDAKKVLHIYIEGDGRPWQSRMRIAGDPTSRFNLMLKLMRQERRDAIYVGRPCYLGLARDDNCSSNDWTYGRFSSAVIDSMASVISAFARDYAGVVLLGHSGGGTLAVLLAERVRATRAVVTVAANLDTTAWTDYHRYTPLVDSRNPASRPPLPIHIRQLHLLGELDLNIKPRLANDWLSRQRNADVWRFDRYVHNCCWGRVWPDVLNWLDGVSGSKDLVVDQAVPMPALNNRDG